MNCVFTTYVQKVLPLVYDESLSYYEVLCRVRDKLNELCKYCDELQNEINNLSGSLESEIAKIVNEYFNKCIQDGTFETLINKTLLNEKMDANSPFLSVPYLSRMWCDDDREHAMQSICFVNGVLYGYSVDKNNTGKLVKFDENFNVLTTTPLNAGHGNAMCYSPNKNKLYFADDTIKMVDFATFGIIGDIPNLSGFYTCCYYENKLYGISNYVLYEIDEETYNLKPIYRLPENSIGANVGGSCIVNDRLYVVSHLPEMITCFEAGKLVKVWNFTGEYGDKTDRITELEGLAYNNTFYVGCYGGRFANAIYTFNPFNGVPTSNNYQYPQFNRQVTIYVNSNTGTINGDGSETKPLKSITSAIEMCKSPYFSGLSVTINATGVFNNESIVGVTSPFYIDGTYTLTNCAFVGCDFTCSGATVTGTLKISNCRFVLNYTGNECEATISNSIGTLNPTQGNNFKKLMCYYAFLNANAYFSGANQRDMSTYITQPTLAYSSNTPVLTASVDGLTSRKSVMFVLKVPTGYTTVTMNALNTTTEFSYSCFTSQFITIYYRIKIDYQSFTVTGGYYDGNDHTGLPTGFGVVEVYNLS